MGNRSEGRKWGILIILVMFILSGVGAALLQKFNPVTTQQSTTAQLPREKILYELSEDERFQILAKGNILIEIEFPANCTECAQMLSDFEVKTLEFSPVVYLLERQTGDNKSSIKISSYYSGKTLVGYNETEIEEFICENVPPNTFPNVKQRCILREI